MDDEKKPEAFRPLGDRVLVRVQSRPERSAGGLYLPSDARGRENIGEVLACGPGRYSEHGVLVPCGVSPGQVVRFDPYRVLLVLDEDGSRECTASVHAKAGQLAVVRDVDILYVVEP